MSPPRTDIHNIGGLTAEEIDRRDAAVLEEARRNRNDIDRLLRCIEPNGKPGLEDRMVTAINAVRTDIMDHIRKTDEHLKRNAAQGDLDVKKELEWERKQRDDQHAANKEMQDKILDNQEKMMAQVRRIFTVVSGFGTSAGIITALRWLGIIHIGMR